MTVPARQWITAEEYVALEREAETKSEYFNGEIFAMAGGFEEHNLIVGNLVRELGQGLKGRPCRVYPSDMRLKISETGLYTYPDVTVVCGERRLEGDRRDTLLNPTLIVEVLSPKTEAYDRGDKFAHYRRLEALQEYVLVSQNRPRVERFLRQGEEWLLTEVSGLEASILFPSTGCTLALAEVYAHVEFAQPEPADRPQS